ncbi:MAG TPA: hypothetical protein PK263_00015 [bacterium]|nr:hypothetical protein [bacterium]
MRFLVLQIHGRSKDCAAVVAQIERDLRSLPFDDDLLGAIVVETIPSFTARLVGGDTDPYVEITNHDWKWTEWQLERIARVCQRHFHVVYRQNAPVAVLGRTRKEGNN